MSPRFPLTDRENRQSLILSLRIPILQNAFKRDIIGEMIWIPITHYYDAERNPKYIYTVNVNKIMEIYFLK